MSWLITFILPVSFHRKRWGLNNMDVKYDLYILSFSHFGCLTCNMWKTLKNDYIVCARFATSKIPYSWYPPRVKTSADSANPSFQGLSRSQFCSFVLPCAFLFYSLRHEHKKMKEKCTTMQPFSFFLMRSLHLTETGIPWRVISFKGFEFDLMATFSQKNLIFLPMNRCCCD